MDPLAQPLADLKAAAETYQTDSDAAAIAVTAAQKAQHDADTATATAAGDKQSLVGRKKAFVALLDQLYPD